MKEQNRTDIILYFKNKGFKLREEFKSFTQLDKGIEKTDKTMSIVLNEKHFYLMLHSKNTGDYIFSQHFLLDLPSEKIKELLEKMSDFYNKFNELF